MATRTPLTPLLAWVFLATVPMTGVAGCGAAAEPSATGSRGPSATTTGPASPSGSPTNARRGGEPAVWAVGPSQNLQGSTTRFTALVTRLDCNGGITGEVLPPEIRASASEIVVTFSVAPKQADVAPCPGNDQVPFEVDLGGPLQGRALVDGHCLPGQRGAGTTFCSPDGVRFKP